jgi:hypothetical protein
MKDMPIPPFRAAFTKGVLKRGVFFSGKAQRPGKTLGQPALRRGKLKGLHNIFPLNVGIIGQQLFNGLSRAVNCRLSNTAGYDKINCQNEPPQGKPCGIFSVTAA